MNAHRIHTGGERIGHGSHKAIAIVVGVVPAIVALLTLPDLTRDVATDYGVYFSDGWFIRNGLLPLPAYAMSLVLQRQQQDYYFYQLVPLLSIMAAIVVGAMADELRSWSWDSARPTMALAIGAVIVTLVLAPVQSYVQILTSVVRGDPETTVSFGGTSIERQIATMVSHTFTTDSPSLLIVSPGTANAVYAFARARPWSRYTSYNAPKREAFVGENFFVNWLREFEEQGPDYVLIWVDPAELYSEHENVKNMVRAVEERYLQVDYGLDFPILYRAP